MFRVYYAPVLMSTFHETAIKQQPGLLYSLGNQLLSSHSAIACVIVDHKFLANTQ